MESEDGTVEEIGTTAEHPFWVEDLGWVPASRLQPGDRLVSNTGGWLKVRQVRGSPRTETVYNFEVAEYHTYFVGESGVWVHNACGGDDRLFPELSDAEIADAFSSAQVREQITDPARLLPPPKSSNPDLLDSPVVSLAAPRGTEIDIAFGPTQPVTKPGGFGTPDLFPDRNYVRNELAVIPAFKPAIGYVQRFEVPEGLRIQFSIVGPQHHKGINYPGGRPQIQILNFADRDKLVPVGPRLEFD